MTTLEITLFGSPKVMWDGRLLSIPRRQVRALLYRLASRLEPVPREQLCFQFWPDVPEAKTRRNLSHLLTHMRRVLPNQAMLLTENDCIRLDPRLAWSDTAAFTRLETIATSRLKPEAIQRLVDLYRGPFLAGFSLPGSVEFEAWITREQQLWERLYLESLLTLIRRWAAQGAYDSAIHYAERYLAIDSLAEEVHNHLISLYALSGNRMAALRQFDQCVIALEREIGVRPLLDTRITYETVLKGGVPATFAAPDQSWTTLPSLDVPLVGREGVLQQLEQAYLQARSGRGTVIFISGEPGSGKSRLLQYFTAQLPDQGTILVGAGHPSAQSLPFQPIVQALSPVIKDVYTTFDGEPIRLVEAFRFWPELWLLSSELTQPPTRKIKRSHLPLFELLCQLVLHISQRSTCLTLCLDDLHWMDGKTLDWLVYLGQRMRCAQLLILGSYRSEKSEAMLALRLSMARLGILTEISLAELDMPAVHHLLQHLTGCAPRGEHAARLHRMTGGNPFFLLETLQALKESGCSLNELPPLKEIPLSAALRTAVAARLAHLNPMTRQILEASAVLPPHFRFEQVRQVAGGGEMETMDGLDTLVSRQLLMQKDHHFCFRHDLLQRLVLESLSPVRHQLLHQRANRFGIDGAAN